MVRPRDGYQKTYYDKLKFILKQGCVNYKWNAQNATITFEILLPYQIDEHKKFVTSSVNTTPELSWVEDTIRCATLGGKPLHHWGQCGTRHDTQYNDTQHNDTQHNDTDLNDMQQNNK